MKDQINHSVLRTELYELHEKTKEAAHKDVLKMIEGMDVAAGKKMEDMPKLQSPKTEDVLRMLNKHRYEGLKTEDTR